MPIATILDPTPAHDAAAQMRAFEAHYGTAPRLYRAPGRVNLIGEHTDYNEGWVMPAAINLAAWVAIAPRSDRRIELRSTHYPDAVAFDLDAPASRAGRHWSDALRGVAALLDRGGERLSGADILIESQVPIGAGLSSSAAVEVALAFALAAENGLTLGRVALDLTALARLCQRASHEFGGTRCGIMDLYIACYGRAGQVAALDTRNLEARWLALPAKLNLMVCDTMVRHDNATSPYNQRRAECEAAVRALCPHHPGLTSLREVSLDELSRHASGLSDVLYARARHVISENARVGAAAAALERGDFAALGRLLAASHRSLRDDYAVSCPELDTMTELCQHQEGVYGARMMGGGFGGCVIALADPDRATALRERLTQDYAGATGVRPTIRICQPAQGAEGVTSASPTEDHAGRTSPPPPAL